MAGRFDRHDHRRGRGEPLAAASHPLRFGRPVAAGLAQTRHTDPLDDARTEADLHRARDAAAGTPSRPRRPLSVPARVWLAVAAAAALWLVIALIVLPLL